MKHDDNNLKYADVVVSFAAAVLDYLSTPQAPDFSLE